MSDAAREAAAALALDMSAELVDKVPVAPSDLAATGGLDTLAADVAAATGAAAAPAPVAEQALSQPPAPAAAPAAPPAEEASQEPVTLPTFEPSFDDEYRELLEEPDFEEEADREIQARLDNDEIDDELDPEAAKKLVALEKRNQWLEAQVVRASKPKWVAEAKRNFPDLARYAPSEIEKIEATSRRSFARAAAQLNDRFAAIAKPIIDDLVSKQVQLREETMQTARSEAMHAWGEPTVGPPVAAVQASEQISELQTARRSGQLHKVVGVLFKQAGLGGGS